jgi:hypothetical protein
MRDGKAIGKSVTAETPVMFRSRDAKEALQRFLCFLSGSDTSNGTDWINWLLLVFLLYRISTK